MTREEILQEFSDINLVYNNCTRYDTLKRMLDELTEPKTGHWIWCVSSHKCSNCEEYTWFSHKELLRYCPNCGAKMEDKE